MKKITLFSLLLATALSSHAKQLIDLNGFWQFRFEEGKSLEETSADFAATDSMPVPGNFDMLPKWLCKRGTGLYRRTFRTEVSSPNAFLVVDGMGLRGRFLLDGKEVGVSALPWSLFELPLGQLPAGEHTLVAQLDNLLTDKPEDIYRSFYDFYLFGGFYRGVSLKLLDKPVELDRAFVRTRDIKTGKVELELLFLGGETPATLDGTVAFDNSPSPSKVTFRNGRAELAVPSFKLWSPSSPNLHTVHVQTSIGEARERFGIREIKAEKGKLWLNGKALVLKGANRHEAHPQFGAATTETLMAQDVQLLQSLGGNFFRGAHYPQNQKFLDLCDERGILVWEESLGWGNNPVQMTNSLFIARQTEQTRLMVRNSFNHPSVIIFAFLNECRSKTQAGYDIVQKLAETIRNEDSGRLVSFACNDGTKDISHALTDIVSLNTYPGWIGTDAGSPEHLRQLMSGEFDKLATFFSNRYPDKPIMISENGTCGIYGQHDPAAAQWTEEFEAEYDRNAVELVLSDPRFSGICIWQFTDSRSYHRAGATIRTKPFAENLAGLYDGYRRPKLAAEAVKQAFSQFK